MLLPMAACSLAQTALLTVFVYLKEPMKSISLKTVCIVGTQHFSAPSPTSTIRPPGATASRAVCRTITSSD